MTQKQTLVRHFPMARWVAVNPENAQVESLAPANGMNVRESKIEAAKEGWASATSSQAAFWGDRGGQPKVGVTEGRLIAGVTATVCSSEARLLI